jgi:hypothetical protein
MQLVGAKAALEWVKATLRRLECSHTGMCYGDEKSGKVSDYARGWGDCLAAMKSAVNDPKQAEPAQAAVPFIEAWTWFDASGESHLSREEPADGAEVYQLTALIAAQAKEPTQPAQPVREPMCGEQSAVYAPLTEAEVHDLSCMQAGASWMEPALTALRQCIAIYERLRAEGKRPVDPVEMTDAEHDAHWAYMAKEVS